MEDEFMLIEPRQRSQKFHGGASVLATAWPELYKLTVSKILSVVNYRHDLVISILLKDLKVAVGSPIRPKSGSANAQKNVSEALGLAPLSCCGTVHQGRIFH